MSIAQQVRQHISEVLADLVAADELPPQAAEVAFKVERPKRPEHGDMATNVAMVLQ